MPSWKKVIISGSDAALNSLNVSTSLTASGIIYPTTDGTSNQVIKTDGNGNLFFDNVLTTTISIKNVSGGTILKGTPCYITGSGTSGNVAGVWPADASNPLRMPAGVIAGEDLNNGDEGIGLLNGFINGVDTSLFNAGDSVYVAAGGGYTNIRPTGSSILVQKLGNVEKIDASNGSGVINGPGYYNDLPNIQQGYTWVGNSDGVAVAVATSSIQNVVSSSYAATSSFTTAVSGTTNYVPKFTASETLGNSQIYDDGTNIGIGTTTPSAKLHLVDTTLAGSGALSGSVLNLEQTWNTTGTPSAIKLNVTDTASNASSLLMDLKVGGDSRFKVDKWGSIDIIANNISDNDNQYIIKGGRPSQVGTIRLFNKSTGGMDFTSWNGATFNFNGNINTTGGLTFGGSLTLGNNQRLNGVSGAYFMPYEGLTGNLIIRSTTVNNISKIRLQNGSSSTDKLTVFPTGNILIQNGGSHIDGGYNLDVNGTQRIQGTLELTNNTGFGIYQSGTANNSFAGNVGIGTTSPSSKLHVYGGNIKIEEGSGGDEKIEVSGGYLAKYNGLDNAWGFAQDNIYIDGSTSSVGIGTTTPSATLDVQGDILIKSANISNQENLDVDTGTEVVATVVIADYDAAFFDFVIKNGTNLRAGTVYAVHDGTNVEYTETSTSDLGNTSDVTLSVDISSGNMRLLATTTTDNWIIKTLVRAI